MFTYFLHKQKNLKSDKHFQAKFGSLIGGLRLYDENPSEIEPESKKKDSSSSSSNNDYDEKNNNINQLKGKKINDIKSVELSSQ